MQQVRPYSELVTMMENQIKVAESKLQFYNYETEVKGDELSALDSDVISKRNFIQNFDNEEGRKRIKEAAKNEIESLMQDNRQLLIIAIFAAIEAIIDMNIDGVDTLLILNLLINHLELEFPMTLYVHWTCST
jgi:hypothetical protein